MNKALKVLQVSQDQWDLLDLLERVVWDILDHKAQPDPQDHLVTLKQVNLVPQVVLENQVLLVFPVKEVSMVQQDQWDPEVHLVPLVPLDLLDTLLLENPDHLEFLAQWDQEESLVLKDILAFLVFLALKEREVLEFLGFKDPQVQLDQWVPAVCLENLELVNLVPLAIPESLESLACQEEMVLPVQWVCQD